MGELVVLKVHEGNELDHPKCRRIEEILHPREQDNALATLNRRRAR
jgi:hypothetical protein